MQFLREFASVKVAPALATPLPVAPAKEASRKLFGSLAVSDHICLISCNSFWYVLVDYDDVTATSPR